MAPATGSLGRHLGCGGIGSRAAAVRNGRAGASADRSAGIDGLGGPKHQPGHSGPSPKTPETEMNMDMDMDMETSVRRFRPSGPTWLGPDRRAGSSLPTRPSL